MKDKKKYLIWMNCYGGWAPEFRSSIETKGYDQYLNEFVRKITPLKNKIKAIYISGGMYDPLGRTECETTKPELEKRMTSAGIEFPIDSDEESVTSASIMEKFLTVWKEKFFETIPLLFVDEVRYEINCFTFHYFCQKLKIEDLKAENVIIPLARLDDHPNSTKEMQDKKLKLMQEKGVAYVEELERKARKEHLKKGSH